MSWFLLMPVIFGSSLVLTMVGLGGGLIFSPLFILLSFPVSTAVSASLFLNGIAAISAAITYFRRGIVDVQIGVPLILSSSLAAPLGALTTSRVDIKNFSTILAGVIVLAAMRMLFSGQVEQEREEVGIWRKAIGGGVIGLVIGFMAGLLGIGGGVFIVPLLIYFLKVPTKIAAATSIFIVVFSSFSGFVTHVSLARADWKLILVAACFSFAGGQVGSRIMAEKLKAKTVRRLFGIVLLAFAFKLIQRVWW
ncbi:MAG: sulfite exporter TauE/SafE family protein [Deltaproteobacteria bacterium]|nr:MAG: sulfite exporter TauE/SafE family protein [Deltaproteobacteria bacterium]